MTESRYKFSVWSSTEFLESDYDFLSRKQKTKNKIKTKTKNKTGGGGGLHLEGVYNRVYFFVLDSTSSLWSGVTSCSNIIIKNAESKFDHGTRKISGTTTKFDSQPIRDWAWVTHLVCRHLATAVRSLSNNLASVPLFSLHLSKRISRNCSSIDFLCWRSSLQLWLGKRSLWR